MKYEKIMTVEEFLERIKNIVENVNTAYCLGVVGSKISVAVIDAKTKQLPDWYTSARIKERKALVNKNYFGFDCVNTIKAVLWEWDGKPNHGVRKNAYVNYASHTVPDTNADGFIKLCEDVSTDMKNILPGEAIWFSGHIGVYVGKINGVDYCYECAPSINKVGLTKMSYQGRWEKHGKIPFLTGYIESKPAAPSFDLDAWKKAADSIISESIGTVSNTVKLIQERLVSLGYNISTDGNFGPKTEASVKQFQKDRHITQTGIVDILTWNELYKEV